MENLIKFCDPMSEYRMSLTADELTAEMTSAAISCQAEKTDFDATDSEFLLVYKQHAPVNSDSDAWVLMIQMLKVEFKGDTPWLKPLQLVKGHGEPIKASIDPLHYVKLFAEDSDSKLRPVCHNRQEFNPESQMCDRESDCYTKDDVKDCLVSTITRKDNDMVEICDLCKPGFTRDLAGMCLSSQGDLGSQCLSGTKKQFEFYRMESSSDDTSFEMWKFDTYQKGRAIKMINEQCTTIESYPQELPDGAGTTTKLEYNEWDFYHIWKFFLNESENEIDQDILEANVSDPALYEDEDKTSTGALYKHWEYGTHVKDQYHGFVDVCRLNVMKD
jgi:hypothetical protein